jgi:polysaccharide export outer membrane protein
MVAGLVACSHISGDYIWIDAVPKSLRSPDSVYRIAPGDVIGVRVFNQDANSVERAKVREDGKITVPLLDEVEVAGMEPSELARRLEVKLKAFIQKPVVTVVVHERRPLRISVLGQVTRPGTYDLEDEAGVLHALAAAGGLTPFANRDAIFVLRRGYWADANLPARIRLRYSDLEQGKAPAAVFVLRRGDVLVVE